MKNELVEKTGLDIFLRIYVAITLKLKFLVHVYYYVDYTSLHQILIGE